MTTDFDLTGWAGHTDPAPDPITADEVRSAPPLALPDLAPDPSPDRRRWLAAAAVVALIAGLAVVLVGRGGPDETTPATTSPTPPPTTTTNPAPPVALVETSMSGPFTDDDPNVLAATGFREPDGSFNGSIGRLSHSGSGSGMLPGTYEFIHLEVPCDGPCPTNTELGRDAEARFDGVEPSCRATVDLAAGDRIRVVVDRHADGTCAIEVGTPVRLVVSTGQLMTGSDQVVSYAPSIVGPDGNEITFAALTSSTTRLALDRPLSPGRYQFQVHFYACSAPCPEVGPDGRPDDWHPPQDASVCNTEFDVVRRVAGSDTEVSTSTHIPPQILQADFSMDECEVRTIDALPAGLGD